MFKQWSRDASARALAELIRTLGDAVLIVDQAGRIRLLNAMGEGLFGYAERELLGEPVERLVPEAARARHVADRQGFVAHARSRPMGAGLELQALRKDGTTVPVEISLSPLEGPDGILVAAVVRDVTARRAAERAVRERETALSLILSSVSDAVIASDAELRLTRWNPAAERMLGWRAEEVLGRTGSEVRQTEFPGSSREQAMHTLATEGVFRGEVLLTHRDGSRVPVETVVTTLRGPNGELLGYVAVDRDISERKRAEAQLLAADRAASVGRLAGGMGHAVNNPLAVVLGNVSLAVERLEHLDESQPLTGKALAELVTELREAERAATQVATIMTDLRRLSASAPGATRPVDPREAVERALRLCGAELELRARLVRDLGSVPPVLADEAVLGQCFLHLLLNAAQALSRAPRGDHEIRVSTHSDAAGNAVVEIADTGPGIPAEVRDALFVPFGGQDLFSGRRQLGLPLVHRTATDLGGTFEVLPRDPRGTIVRLTLPAIAAKELGAHPVESAAASPARGRVLVVDDDPLIRSVLKRVLSAEHDVTLLPDGSAALDYLVGGAPADLVLCDLMMPGLSGADLYERLQEVRPEILPRVVFITGGAFREETREFLARANAPCLQKPIAPAELRAFVAARLAG
ncbi:MAG: PAS domain S-box protein [Deltaproteobacteria bacterium]|nr:PAS domain S-box protein [Deltaproteobacteria bacterium]